jgi:hypothetical protein
MIPSIPDLYLAYRQAKIAHFFERRGVGLLDFARFEEHLPDNLAELESKLARSCWFDSLNLGEVWVVPKRLRDEGERDGDVIGVGAELPTGDRRALDIQLRLSPSPEFSTVEVLYLWRFGAWLEASLSPEVLGYRLDLRNNELTRHRRWLFEYWPKRYQQFRTDPLSAARQVLAVDEEPVLIISADLTSFYDTIDPSFMLQEEFVSSLAANDEGGPVVDTVEFVEATNSLLGAFERFRAEASRRSATSVTTGVPIGALTSRVVANTALAPLDRYISEIPNVVCYRRYVDDIVIVVKGHLGAMGSEEVLRSYFPLCPSDDSMLPIDVEVLGRNGSCFQLQKSKTRVHHLCGVPGCDFVDAVVADFDRLVSESRSFLDQTPFLVDGFRHLVRAGEARGSPLRVLRDADRARLEKFALSTCLKSLERASSLVDQEHAREAVRRNLEPICRVLKTEGNWLENFDTALRLLKLAISTDDWVSVSELNSQLDEVVGNTDALRVASGELRFRGKTISPERRRPWIWLRNYFHARRLEAVCSTLPATVAGGKTRKWPQGGLTVGSSKIGPLGLRNRAASLARADLRARDREDDRPVSGSDDGGAAGWMYGTLESDTELVARVEIIGRFVERCRQLGDHSWLMPPARLFLCTRPPSYFDIARRWLYRTEGGFDEDIFVRLLEVVNAIRGTEYTDPVGTVVGPYTVAIPGSEQGLDQPSNGPRIILGNLVLEDDYFVGAATHVPGSPFGRPRLDLTRLQGLAAVLRRANRASSACSSALLVLPELALPRQWFRTVANHVVRHGRYGLVVGLEYLHDPTQPSVCNQVFTVMPGPFSSVATWPWTKRRPAEDEKLELSKLPTPVAFPSPPPHRPRAVVKSPWGDISILICSEMIEARRVSDLLGRAEVVLCPAWNKDTSSYEHLIQSVGFQLHAIVAVANNGHYSDCRAWAPQRDRWKRDLCRLIERDANEVVYVDIPLTSLREFHLSGGSAHDDKWRPLPPDWP